MTTSPAASRLGETWPYDPDALPHRRMRFRFDETPALWLDGDAVRTHFVDGLHLLLPAFEGMIGRVIARSLAAHPDLPEELVAQARAFAAQEAEHASAHRSFVEHMRARYPLDRHLSRVARVLGPRFERRLGLELALAVIVAFEHFTDLFVGLLSETDFLVGVDPTMKRLLEWHAAEEVEHHAVAHALFEATGGGTAARWAGAGIALGLLYGMIASAMLLLLRQDGRMVDARTARGLARLLVGEDAVLPRTVHLLRTYVSRPHAPPVSTHRAFAERVLAGLGS